MLDPGELRLWTSLRVHGDRAAREQLYVQHVPWASAIARRVHRRFASFSIDRDDFIQNASIGLLEAIDRYEPDRGVAFRAYALPRVRGSVFNGIRALLGGVGQTPGYAQRLESLQDGRDDDAFNSVVAAIVGLGLGYMLDDAARMVGGEMEDGAAYAHASQMTTRLLVAVERLPQRQRAIIKRHYFEFGQFSELATEWGVTKGRISQLHRAALDNLRTLLAE